MAVTAKTHATTEPLFPASSVVPARPARVRNIGVSGPGRATRGNRKNNVTSVLLNPFLEELLDDLLAKGHGESIGDILRQGIECLAENKLGADAVEQIGRELSQGTGEALTRK